MRFPSRLAVTIVALVAAPLGVAVWSCGTNAVGTQACTTIEDERCQLAPMCVTGFNVAECERFYRDECLVGIENTAQTNNTTLNEMATTCVWQLNAVAGCVPGGPSDAATCAELLSTDASCTEIEAGASPCNIITACPELLPGCSFVVPDAGSDASDASADATDDGGADASDDATDDGGADASDGAADDGGGGSGGSSSN